MAPRTAMLRVLVLFVALLLARAFPIYSSSNGSVLLQSAYDGDVTLDAGSGKVAVRGLLSADSGVTTSSVTLNATTLNEVLLSSLAGLVQAQTTSLQQISAVFTAQTNVLTLQAMAANVTALQEHQKGLIESLSSLVSSTLSDAVAAVSAAIAANQDNVTATMAAQEASVTGSIASYYELVNSTQALQTQLLAPPVCTSPGGDKLQFDGSVWLCVCVPGWSGATCNVPPSPPPPLPPPPPPSPPLALYTMATPINITSCGHTGAVPPSVTTCQAYYNGRYSWSPYDASIYNFGYPPTATATAANWQRLVLPSAGAYKISAAGAAGAAGLTPGSCRGAVLTGTFTLSTNSPVIYVMVGQFGCTGQFGTEPPSGGGTFVLDGDGNSLVVAGGGSGGWSVPGRTPPSTCDASLTTTANSSPIGSNNAGGNSGNGGACTGVGNCFPGCGLTGSCQAYGDGSAQNQYLQLGLEWRSRCVSI